LAGSERLDVHDNIDKFNSPSKKKTTINKVAESKKRVQNEDTLKNEAKAINLSLTTLKKIFQILGDKKS
jgi:hypothetical protein